MVTAPVTADVFKLVLGHFLTGVAVVTAYSEDDGPLGFTCQSLCALSLNPPMILVCPSKTSLTWPGVARAGTFCVNMLAAGQRDLCDRFARSGGDKFTGVAWRPGQVARTPLLDGALAWIECELARVHDGGDHWIATAHVLDLEASAAKPLTYFRGDLAGRYEPS